MPDKKHLIYSLCLLFAVCGSAFAGQWRGIVPLRSTRADVEKILGKPVPDSKAADAANYKTAAEGVFVLYSTGSCDVKPSNGWNIPRGTVIKITVEPNDKPKFAGFKFDEAEFRKNRDPEVLYLTSYLNEKDGISFEVDTDEKVINTFRYFPESKYDSLLCSTNVN